MTKAMFGRTASQRRRPRAAGRDAGSQNAPNRGRKILVTGGAGFVGSHLCERLVRRGDSVVCFDDLTTGSISNVAPLLERANFSFVAGDVTNPAAYDNVDLTGLAEIYNLACPASPADYQSDPVRTVRTSVFGIYYLLALARHHDAALLQASTSEVYGDPAIHPQRETYWGNVNPIGPRACYDEGKRCAETLCADHRRQYGTVTKIVRIFNTYGPRMRPTDGRVVSNFIVQALRGEDLTIYGDGDQTRSFCFVDDLVEGLVRFMAADTSIGGPINLGNPGEFTVRSLAELVLELTGSRSRIVRRPLPVDDPRQRRPDISTAARLLDWHPTIDLVEGLARTIVHFDALLSQTPAAVLGAQQREVRA